MLIGTTGPHIPSYSRFIATCFCFPQPPPACLGIRITSAVSVTLQYSALHVGRVDTWQSCVTLFWSVSLLKTSEQSSCIISSLLLYYTLLYFTILYYTLLYFTILYYTLLYFTILYYTLLYFTILYYCQFCRDLNQFCIVSLPGWATQLLVVPVFSTSRCHS